MAAVLGGQVGDEVAARILKAKVKVMQEQMQTAALELRARDERIVEMETKCAGGFGERLKGRGEYRLIGALFACLFMSVALILHQA